MWELSDNLKLLEIEIDVLENMIEELHKRRNYKWGTKTCPVCIKATEFGEIFGENKCDICTPLDIRDRCYYLDNYRGNDDVRVYDTGVRHWMYTEKQTSYLLELFENYIRQIKDKMGELADAEATS